MIESEIEVSYVPLTISGEGWEVVVMVEPERRCDVYGRRPTDEDVRMAFRSLPMLPMITLDLALVLIAMAEVEPMPKRLGAVDAWPTITPEGEPR